MVLEHMICINAFTPDECRRRFFSGAIAASPVGAGLKWRIRLVYPLFALKWCTILLNEFVPEEAERRMFALHRDFDRETILSGQLAKARSMLQRARESHDEFPYNL